MSKFMLGFIVGVLSTTIGFAGMATMLDNGVVKIQNAAKESIK